MKKLFNILAILPLALITANAQQKTYSLEFNSQNYTLDSAKVEGKTLYFRAYKNIVYVKNPVDITYQSLNFYVPIEYYKGKSVGEYNQNNAPIFLPNNVGGYMPAKPGTPSIDQRSGKPNAALTALSHGLIVAYPGARGRSLKNEQGKYYGKAPADIVDLKAAVRYLAYNDKNMPGDARKIISNGTSAGGAMSVLLGGTGDAIEFIPYLKDLGAADASDAIFAVSAYCPITNLDHADAAYEWQFGDVKEYKKMQISQMIDFRMERKMVEGVLSEKEIAISAQLKSLFPAYINSLNLKDKKGNIVKLNQNGEGSFRNLVASYIQASAQKELDKGADLSSFKWLTIQEKKVTGLDFKAYVKYTQRMKLPPAFDGLNLENGENDLFGTESDSARHFTSYSLRHGTKKAKMADKTIIKMMNPMYFIMDSKVKVAPHWRIRHGTIDKDGSLAIPVILATKLQNSGYDVDLAFPWETPHSGDYDLNELFNWIGLICIK
ncbi:alpha/beta hydrolase [Apibacter raozihei]|uniref:subtype B tannase n=1 Tax=Apibacter raozihei TaxID=2500547 RepID=UPI000FE43013|nr:subtype B tannase [Apibacter raozihei]